MAFLDLVTSLLPIVGQVAGYAKANKSVSKYNVPTAGENRSNALYEALLDPNNQLLNRLSEQERGGLQQKFLSQLREMQYADRRAQSLGRAPTFFNPERADEALDFLTSRGLPMLDAIASERAQSRITGAASGIAGLIPTQAKRNAIGMQQGISQGGVMAGAGDYFSQNQPNNFYNAMLGGYNSPMVRGINTYNPQDKYAYSNNLGLINW